ncbi:flagellin [Agaricicola taiwanensis]|uniref:Flagellin n=1 Tax=Agaricicola taiwanensis TaxID=591372 RepID=A0A8J2VXA4_9RHOB|nr:flagellin [Agaricicola taiwanensis]GGE40534.1 flagellin [Agaricicola taiwanensis]
MASDITLSNAVRNNLLSLQNTADLLGRTQERLATGKKVNSALDNPTNFFTASSLTARSSDLSSLLDSVSNSVQALKAADTGISGLTKLVESAKATARQALQAPVAYTQKPSVTSNALTGISADALTGTTNKVTGTKAGLTLDKTLNEGSITIATANGAATTITVGAAPGNAATVGDVIDQINSVSGLAARLTDTGKLEITSADGTGVQINYKGGAADLAAGPSETTGTVAVADDAALQALFATDKELTLVAEDGDTSTITLTATSTKEDLLTALNANGFSAEFDTDNQLRVGREDGQSFTVSGTAATDLGITNGTFVAASQGGSFTAPPPGTSQVSGTVAVADDAALQALAGEINLVAEDGDSATYTIDGTSTIADLTSTLTANGFTVSFDSDNQLKIARDDGQSFSVAGTGAAALGIDNGTTVPAYDPADTAGPLEQLGLSSTYSNNLDGKSLTVTTGQGTSDERTVTVSFGVGEDQVNSIAALNQAFGDAGVAVEALVVNGSLKIQSTNAAAGQTFEIEGTALGATGTDAAFTSATGTTKESTPATFGGAGDESRKAFVKDYNDLLKQINVLASDSSYNGINLLAGDDLSVVFNENGSSKLDIKGVSFDAEGLGLNDITESDFRDSQSVNNVIGKLDAALGSLRSQASKFGSNLSIVETRQNFTKELINVLDTGAANLTLADTNEEGANALALQTRQQLSTTALSLSSQADQAVLRLF